MEDFIIYILKLIYFLLPGGFANMAPIIVKNYFKKLDYPLDFNIRFMGKPIFGMHKTFRGLIFGVVFSILASFIQDLLFKFQLFRSISLLDYSQHSFIIIGFLFGFGALFGDMLKSFIKRRVNIMPGKPFFPLDQIDWIIGIIIFLSFIYKFTLDLIIGLFVISLLLHLLTRTLGYYLKINKERW